MKTHDGIVEILLLRDIKNYNDCILTLAYKCGCEKFMSELVVQNLLDVIWFRNPMVVDDVFVSL